MKQKKTIGFFSEFILSRVILSILPRRADSGQDWDNLFSTGEIWEWYQKVLVSFLKTISERLSFRFWRYYSVQDPESDPDPPDPHVFGPPVSGSGGMDPAPDQDPSTIMQK
jgi:hypothetical protein